MKLSITFDRLRWEEKWLIQEARKLGCTTELIDVKNLSFEITGKAKNGFGDVVLQRCISYYRSLFLTKILENFDIPVVNTSKVSELCGNKLVTSMLLAKAGILTPKTYVALSSDSVGETAEALGFPVVMKPFIGSWGRMVSLAKDRQTLDTIVELKEAIQNPIEHMYYLQEYVKRPPRDIRAIVAGDEIVAAVYRNAHPSEWRTNVARGATTAAFKPDKELKETVLKAAELVGGGVLGVDAMESKEGYMIHEVNNTVEFKGAQAASKTKIAKKIVEYVIGSAKRYMVRVGIVGASGLHAGGELIRLLLKHGQVELAFATSRKNAGEYLFRVHPNLRSMTEMKFIGNDLSNLSGMADLVFTALPHGESVKFMPQLAASGVKIVDLSADFRLKDPADYETWYGYQHPSPELLEKFVYAVPELNREAIAKADLAASPGCMAITSILAMAPLFKQKEVPMDRGHVVVDAKIASSGSGGKPSLSTHFSERYGVVRPYKPSGHRHTGEIEQQLSWLADGKVTVSMSAHAINMVRGILSTCHVFYEGDIQNSNVWKMYRSAYSGRPFIRLVKDKKGPFRLPDPKVVIGSNFCDVGFELDERGHRIVAMAAIDNLVKGAAGNAVQVMNIMLGMDEKQGIWDAPLHPV